MDNIWYVLKKTSGSLERIGLYRYNEIKGIETLFEPQPLGFENGFTNLGLKIADDVGYDLISLSGYGIVDLIGSNSYIQKKRISLNFTKPAGFPDSIVADGDIITYTNLSPEEVARTIKEIKHAFKFRKEHALALKSVV